MAHNLSETDRIRIAEAFHMAEQLTGKVWSGWRVPFAVLLVISDTEWLIRHPKPSPDFTSQGHDDLLNSTIYSRPRVFPIDLLATFPVWDMHSTVIVGQAENTFVQTSSPWVLTLLHEHFHQWQDSQPGIYDEMLALNLSGGDSTGMWMLNYPFPYDDPEVQIRFHKLTTALAAALKAVSTNTFPQAMTNYLEEQTAFRDSLRPDDWRYFQFQLWKEGIARYTEYRLAVLAASDYTPSREFCDLEDFTPYVQTRDALHAKILDGLPNLNLGHSQRGAFYAYGAAEALLLDMVNADWQTRYFEDKFTVDGYFVEG